MFFTTLKPITRRLLPLYISAFLQGLPFWYAIEKLFMTSIGFDAASIGVMVAIMSAVMLTVETPSGVWADRWSRKGVMLLGCLALLISGAVGAVSYNEPVYILSTVFWGIYAALYSGTYDSVIYDTTLEENGNATRYEHYLGRMRMVEGLAFIVGALVGGLIASTLSMRQTYYMSLPLILLAVVFLLRFREPTLHKSEVAEPVLKHIRQTFAAVLRNRLLLPIVIATVGFAVLLDTLMELNQLWFIAISTPVALYGLIGAVVLSVLGFGGLLAGTLRSRYIPYAGLCVLLGSLLGLVMFRNYWLILLALFLLGGSLVAFGVILSKKLHDALPSNIRAGSASVISTLGRCIIIPLSLVFTAIANTRSVFSATYLLLGIAVISIVAYLFILRRPLQAT